jgi:two-component system chemotaxis response regulator CheB
MSSDPIKVLVVDDSSVARRFVCSAIEETQDLRVVGRASNGQEALEFMAKLHPDIITLDVEMPIMDGITTLEHIRRRDRTIPVIMFSTLTERGARTTLEALSRGANDYIAKPSSLGGSRSAPEEVKQEIVSKIMAHTRLQKLPGTVAATKLKNMAAPLSVVSPIETELKVRAPGPSIEAPAPKLHGRRHETAKLDVSTRAVRTGKTKLRAVGIGVSTGGPNAMAEVFKDLNRTLPVPVFITQHMPAVFTTMFAERLGTISGLAVFEATDGQEVRAGEVYVAPGGFHMEVVRRGAGEMISLNQNPPENSCRPAVDVMFRSMVKVYGQDILGVILTGMGYDGLKGSEEIVKAGGEVIAQDEETSAVWGMPGAVAHAGLASVVVPLSNIASTILQRLR